MDKKHLIIDQSRVSPEMIEAINRQYPLGFEKALITRKNPGAEIIHFLPLEFDDAIYMVKIHADHVDTLLDADDFDSFNEIEPGFEGMEAG